MGDTRLPDSSVTDRDAPASPLSTPQAGENQHPDPLGELVGNKYVLLVAENERLRSLVRQAREVAEGLTHDHIARDCGLCVFLIASAAHSSSSAQGRIGDAGASSATSGEAGQNYG